jgi:hypothetical protein
MCKGAQDPRLLWRVSSSVEHFSVNAFRLSLPYEFVLAWRKDISVKIMHSKWIVQRQISIYALPRISLVKDNGNNAFCKPWIYGRALISVRLISVFITPVLQ